MTFDMKLYNRMVARASLSTLQSSPHLCFQVLEDYGCKPGAVETSGLSDMTSFDAEWPNPGKSNRTKYATPLLGVMVERILDATLEADALATVAIFDRVDGD